jgi:RNA polymerase sigma factor for flagellar operon FliA
MIAGRMMNHSSGIPDYEINDLVSEGYKGYADACQKFDASRGVSFKTYAEFRIKGAIKDYFRDQSGIIRSTKFLPTFVSFDEIMESTPEEPHAQRRELIEKTSTNNGYKDILENERICEAILALPEKEQDVVMQYYFDDRTMEEIGGNKGLTEGRVSQLHTKAITRLNKYMTGGLIMSGRPSLTPEKITEYAGIIKTSGNLNEACKLIGCSNYTPYLWRKKFPEIRDAMLSIGMGKEKVESVTEKKAEFKPITFNGSTLQKPKAKPSSEVKPDTLLPSVRFGFQGIITLFGIKYDVDIKIREAA